MSVRNKYVHGMDEIKASDDLKQLIIQRVSSSVSAPQKAARVFQRKVAMITVSCLVILLLAIGAPYVLRTGDQANPPLLFNGFVITAYAADGAPLVVKPDVEFPLGQYSMFMSSVPGFPVGIGSEGTDHIEVQTSEGQLLRWHSTDAQVISQGKRSTIDSGDIIYWSPVANGGPSQIAATDSILEISAYKKNTKVGSATMEIYSEDSITYKGRLIP